MRTIRIGSFLEQSIREKQRKSHTKVIHYRLKGQKLMTSEIVQWIWQSCKNLIV